VIGCYGCGMRIPIRPLEHVRAMQEHEWQELLDRQEKRMRRKGRPRIKQFGTHSKSEIDQRLQRFVSLPRATLER
jgi:hypothetical protein